MKINLDLNPIRSFENRETTEKKLPPLKQEAAAVEQNDPYSLDVEVREAKNSPIQNGPSWPHDCDTQSGNCTGQGTYATSCNGTCHRDCQ